MGRKKIPAPESGRDAAKPAGGVAPVRRLCDAQKQVLIHADLAAVFSGAAVIAAQW